jgi:hypothetical protein
VFTIRAQRCHSPFWLVELLDILEVELKNAIALDLLARVRTEIIRMGWALGTNVLKKGDN